MTKVQGMLKVTQVVSAIRRPQSQSQTLKGLGLKKLHQTRLLEDTASIRGMIEKVKHLVICEVLE